ncbi:hypothetical protein EJB05_05568, partial [Eragrostis curvula]
MDIGDGVLTPARNLHGHCRRRSLFMGPGWTGCGSVVGMRRSSACCIPRYAANVGTSMQATPPSL